MLLALLRTVQMVGWCVEFQVDAAQTSSRCRDVRKSKLLTKGAIKRGLLCVQHLAHLHWVARVFVAPEFGHQAVFEESHVYTFWKHL